MVGETKKPTATSDIGCWIPFQADDTTIANTSPQYKYPPPRPQTFHPRLKPSTSTSTTTRKTPSYVTINRQPVLPQQPAVGGYDSDHIRVQRFTKRLVRGWVKFVPALAYLFCLALPGSCLTRFAYLLVHLCVFDQLPSDSRNMNNKRCSF